jgi:hypothetical protein
MCFDTCRNDGPIGLGLQFAAAVDCLWVGVIDKHDPMPDEHTVFYANPFADERVAGYLATVSDFGPSLNFNEGTDSRRGSHGASVEVYEFRMMDGDTLPKSDII